MMIIITIIKRKKQPLSLKLNTLKKLEFPFKNYFNLVLNL